MWYNLNMMERKLKEDEFIHITDGNWTTLASAPDGYYEKLSASWQRPRARIKNIDMTYRSLNYLSSIGLFSDNREQDGKGWRELSYVECVYLTLVSELRQFNTKAETIQRVFNAFNKDVEPKEAMVYSGVWLDAFMLIHCLHTEVYLIINPNGEVRFLDAGSAFFYLEYENRSGVIFIPLSTIVNKFRRRNNLKHIEIKYDIFSDGLKNSERDMVIEARKLGENEKLEYTKKKRGGLITTSQKIDKEMLKELSSLVDEDFGSIKAVKEGGKVVSAQKEVRNLVIDD